MKRLFLSILISLLVLLIIGGCVAERRTKQSINLNKVLELEFYSNTSNEIRNGIIEELKCSIISNVNNVYQVKSPDGVSPIDIKHGFDSKPEIFSVEVLLPIRASGGKG